MSNPFAPTLVNYLLLQLLQHIAILPSESVFGSSHSQPVTVAVLVYSSVLVSQFPLSASSQRLTGHLVWPVLGSSLHKCGSVERNLSSLQET